MMKETTVELRILGIRYRIVYVTAKDSPLLDGSHDLARSIIRVRTGECISDDFQRETTFHEILHAASSAIFSDEHSGELTEAQVHGISRALFAICADNPVFMRSLLLPEHDDEEHDERYDVVLNGIENQ